MGSARAPHRLLFLLGLSVSLTLSLSFGCAHTGTQGEAEPATSTADTAASTPSPEADQPVRRWDPPRPDAFEECRIEGEQATHKCRDQWGHFFLRVLNQHQLSIPAYLSVNPAVNRVVASEDGYSGLLRPGKYELTIESPGYEPATVTFEVGASQKAMLEVVLDEAMRTEATE